MPSTITELPDGTYSVAPPEGAAHTYPVLTKDDADKLAAALDEGHEIEAETARIIKLTDKLLVWLPNLRRCVMAKSEAHAAALLAEGVVFKDAPEDFDPDDYFVEEQELSEDDDPAPDEDLSHKEEDDGPKPF